MVLRRIEAGYFYTWLFYFKNKFAWYLKVPYLYDLNFKTMRILRVKNTDNFKLISFCKVNNLKGKKPVETAITFADYDYRNNTLSIYSGGYMITRHYFENFKRALKYLLNLK